LQYLPDIERLDLFLRRRFCFVYCDI